MLATIGHADLDGIGNVLSDAAVAIHTKVKRLRVEVKLHCPRPATNIGQFVMMTALRNFQRSECEMGRSSGYRPTKENREEVQVLRYRLSQTKGSDWQKARGIMHEITYLLGHRGGPTGGSIDPRACRYCDFYGHTRQWCPKRMHDEKVQEEREYDKEIAANAKWLRTNRARDAE